ncbi:MAG: hydroxyacid dehydrogenase, partial [Allobranchiibius sp.]
MAAVVSLESEAWCEELADIDGLETVVWDMAGDPPRDDIELVVPPYAGMTSAKFMRLTSCTQLQAVQLVTAGYENALPHLPPGVRLANGAGIHDTSTAELA